MLSAVLFLIFAFSMATFSELGRVEAVAKLFEGTGYKPFLEPLFFETAALDTVFTASRALLEGVDFDLTYFPLKHLGYKSVVAVTGELYASLSRPQTLGVVLGVSAKLDYDQIKELWEGVVTACKEYGYKYLSLELEPSKNGLCISVNAAGSRSKQTSVHISRPQSKDLVCISGRLGAAYLGQQVLERKPDELQKYRMMLAAYLKPELDPGVLRQLDEASVAPSSGYFVTKGLADAVLRLGRDSGLGVKIYADKIPFEGNSFSLGRELDVDPVSAAMNGGDDHVLMYVVPIAQFEAFSKEFKTFSVIGHMAQPEVGAVLVSPDGLEHPVSAPGWL